jgi:hypothetical protein
VVGVVGGPLSEEGDDVGMKRDQPVVAELADRDTQPIGIPDSGARARCASVPARGRGGARLDA